MKRTGRRTVAAAPGPAPYSPSWVDRWTSAVDRSRLPPSFVYLMLFALVLAIVVGLAWLDDPSAANRFFGIYFLTAAWAVFPLALIHHLDRVSDRALAQFRPACDLDDADAEQLRAELTVMPSRPATLVGLAGAAFIWLFYLTNRAVFTPMLGSPAQFVAGMTVMTFSFALLAVLLYHTVRQIRLVSRIYGRVVRLDLFNLSPLYGFAALAARTSMAWAIALYASLALNPVILESAVALAAFLLQVLLVLGTFAWPLVGIHNRITREKEAALAEVGESLKRAIAEVNRRTRSMSLTQMDALNKMIVSLVASRDVLARVPTWPWSPGTPVAVGSALLLPVGLYLAQRLAERLVGL